MAAGFGFSVGDLIAGLRIIYVSCGAVSNASSAQSDYTSLSAEVRSLLAALEAIDELDLERRGTERQWSALRAAVLACKTCIDEFMAKTSKYEPHLQAHPQAHPQGGRATTTTTTTKAADRRWSAGYRRIKWAICKKEDVATFRAQLERHASSLNMLLITFQARDGMSPTVNRGEAESSALAISKASEDDDDNTARLLQGLTVEQRQCFQLLLSQNRQLQQSLDDIRNLLQVQVQTTPTIPPQVMLQQPVILLDAFGKTAPFHLEFIDSLDAFLAVLRIRSERAGVRHAGLRKIDNCEFHIRDSRRRRDINVTRPWGSVFRPGQSVDMSMVYRRSLTPSVCPQCGCENDNGDGFEDMECDACGLWYHKITEEKLQKVQPVDPPSRLLQYNDSRQSQSQSQNHQDTTDESDFSGYRRIRIIPVPEDITDHAFQLESGKGIPRTGSTSGHGQRSPGKYPQFFGMDADETATPKRAAAAAPRRVKGTPRPTVAAAKKVRRADPPGQAQAPARKSPVLKKVDIVTAPKEIPVSSSPGRERTAMQWTLIDSRSR